MKSPRWQVALPGKSAETPLSAPALTPEPARASATTLEPAIDCAGAIELALGEERDRLAAQLTQLQQALQQTRCALDSEMARAHTLEKQREQLVAQNSLLRAELAEAELRELSRREQIERLTRWLNAARREKAAAEVALTGAQLALDRLLLAK